MAIHLDDLIPPIVHKVIEKLRGPTGIPIPPPPEYKQGVVKEYGEMFALTTLVETGTFHGDMIWACRDLFNELTTIELDPVLSTKAKKRFEAYDHIHVIQGDSGERLATVLEGLHKPTLFWLDAHFSGGETARAMEETPIAKELRAILDHPVKGHVILIDDARLFVGDNDYPKLSEIEEMVRRERPDLAMKTDVDIIRIWPK
jgi:hypothetical protein